MGKKFYLIFKRRHNAEIEGRFFDIFLNPWVLSDDKVTIKLFQLLKFIFLGQGAQSNFYFGVF